MSATTKSPISGLQTRLDSVVDQALATRRIVGAVILVAQEGKIVYDRAAGFADREAGRRMEPNAIFRLASVTKPIVSAVIMRLIEEGVLDLDTPITKWLPDFRPRLADGAAPDISIRQLLAHTAGLSYRFLEQPGSPYHLLDISDGLDQPGLSIEENLTRLAQAPLAFAPGGGWRYSLAIDVLGAVASAATGMTLAGLVEQYVTGPLGMNDTAFSVNDPGRLAVPYADGAEGPIRMEDGMLVSLYDAACAFAPSRILDAGSYHSGGAGMVGTAHDILAFLEAIRTGGSPILRHATVDQMMTDQVGAQAETQGPGWGFGFGWSVLSDKTVASTPQAEGTIQWGGAYGHYWFVDRSNGVTAVQLTNTAFEGMSGTFPMEVRDAIYAGWDR